jgi:hypothetical protein
MLTNEQQCIKYGIEPDNFWDFIYRESDIDEDEIIYQDHETGEFVFDYPMIFMLYLKHYHETTIEANFQFTSFPVYPNMEHFKTSGTYLRVMNVQPNMETCSIEYAEDLEVFPSQPRLQTLLLNMNHSLKIIQTQPEMTDCTLCDILFLETLEYQPKLENLFFIGDCHVENPIVVNKNTKIHGDTKNINITIKY